MLLDEILGGGVGKLVQQVVGTFKLSPEAQNEFNKQIEEHAFELRKMDTELESKLADTAGQNIRAESTSTDKFTSRARPMFCYIVEAVIGYNYIIAPTFKRDPVVLPGDLLTLFGFIMMGYVGGRTIEKIAMFKAGLKE